MSGGLPEVNTSDEEHLEHKRMINAALVISQLLVHTSKIYYTAIYSKYKKIDIFIIGIKALKIVKKSESRLAVSRRAVLAGSGSAALALLTGSAAASSHTQDTSDQQSNHKLEVMGRYESEIFDEGAAEIASYEPTTQQVFVVNADAGQADVLDFSDPTTPTKSGGIDPRDDLSGFSVGSVNSVDTHGDTVALAVEADSPASDGRVAFYDATGTNNFLGSAPTGSLPDLVKFTPDGNTVFVANEGEPSDNYGSDPEGSVSVIDVSGSDGFSNPSEQRAGFGGFDATSLRENGVRVFGPGSTASQDLEPESVVAGPNSETAYVSLQENNAIAIMDISDSSNPTVDSVVPLGYKDHSVMGNEIDAIDNGNINIRNEPIFGMYQPDVIETAEINGETYLVTASEGDAREYAGLFETGILTNTGTETDPDFQIVIDDEDIDGGSDTPDVDIDESAFSDGVLSRLENLEVTARPPGNGDSDPGVVNELYVFGGRSYMILDSQGEIVFESGSQLEEIVRDSQQVPTKQFNAENDEINDSDDDSESEASGPEPEGVAVGQVGDRTYAFIGLEEVGGIAAFDISTPTDPSFVDYINDRNFNIGPEDDIEIPLENGNDAEALDALRQVGDLGPEGIDFVPASESPTEDPMIIVGHEVSGTTTAFGVVPESESGSFDGIVAEYNTNNNDTIELSELGQAGRDFASGELSITELGKIGAAFAS